MANHDRKSVSLVLRSFLLGAFMMFAIRGVYRGIRHQLTNDFFSIYTIARAWLAGRHLYSTPVFIDTFQRASGYTLGRNTLPLAAKYTALPPMVPLMAPFSVFRWQVANTLWVLFGASIVLLMLRLFCRGFAATQRDRFVFLTCCLLLAPLQTGLACVNVTPLLIGLMGISYLLHRDGKWAVAGILLGFVGCCKPHIAGAMVLVLCAESAWKTLGVSVVTGLSSPALFMGRLAVASVPWWDAFYQRTRQFGAVGDANDFSLANSARYELTNLQVIFGSITSSRVLANAAAILIGLALVGVWWIIVRRQGRATLLQFAAINVILLLPSYHRFDDASVLVFLFAAAFLEGHLPDLRKIAVATICVFALPLSAAFVYLAESGRIPIRLLHAPAFQLTFLTFHIWYLLALAVVLLKLMATEQVEERTLPTTNHATLSPAAISS